MVVEVGAKNNTWIRKRRPIHTLEKREERERERGKRERERESERKKQRKRERESVCVYIHNAPNYSLGRCDCLVACVFTQFA